MGAHFTKLQVQEATGRKWSILNGDNIVFPVRMTVSLHQKTLAT